MSIQELPIISKATQDAHIWLKDLSSMLGWDDDRRRAYRLLRALLHVLRDRVPLNEAAQFGAQLPVFFRSVYYEGWSPKTPLSELRRKDDFVWAVTQSFEIGDLDDPEKAVRTAIEFISRQISPGEIDDIKACMPADIKQLWP